MDLRSISNLKQLDFILNRINQIPNKNQWRKYEEFCNEIAGENESLAVIRSNSDIIWRVVRKLKDDGYILEDKREHNDTWEIFVYHVTINGEILIESGGYKWKKIRDYSGVFFKYSISFAVCAATIFGVFFSHKQNEISRWQYEIQLREKYEEHVTTSLIELLNKQQIQLNKISNRCYSQPTVAVKNYMRK